MFNWFWKKDGHTFINTITRYLVTDISKFKITSTSEYDVSIRGLMFEYLPTRISFYISSGNSGMYIRVTDPYSVSYTAKQSKKFISQLCKIFPFEIDGKNKDEERQKQLDYLIKKDKVLLKMKFISRDRSRGIHIESFIWLYENFSGRYVISLMSSEGGVNRYLIVFDKNEDAMAMKLKYQDYVY